MSVCSKAIRTAVGDDVIGEAEATNILQRMENIAKARQAEKGIRMDEAIKEIAGEMRAGHDSLRLIDQRNRLLSLAATRAQVEKIVNSKQLYAIGYKRSLEQTWEKIYALERRFYAPFAAKLKELKLDRVFRNQQESKAFFDEAWNVESGGTAPVTQGDMGRRIFELMQFYVAQRKQRNAMLNMRGAFFSEDRVYGFMQSYSTEKVQALGATKGEARGAFLNLVSTMNIDPITYEGRDAALFWSNVFDNLYSGEHRATPHSIDIDKFSGVHGSLANKLSQNRLVWFADADSQWRWNETIGAGNYGEIMMREMGNAARSIGLMSDWGPNWRNNANLVWDTLAPMARDREDSAKQMKAFKGFNNDAYLRILSGESEIPNRPTLARWVSNITAFIHTAKMGAATIASIPDLVQVRHTMAVNGMGALDRFMAQLDVSTPKEILEGLSVVSNGFIGSLHNRFGLGPMSNGMARASHLLFEANFFNKWNDMNQEVTAKALSWWLGRHADVAFDALPEGLRTQLSKADIKAADWDAIRPTARTLPASEITPDAKKFVMLDTLGDIPDAAIDRILSDRGMNPTAANRTRARQDLDMRLSTYFSQQVNAALNTPDLRTKYITTFGGAQAGTLPRAVADLLMIFKSFPLSVALRMKRRAEDAGLFAGAWGEKQWSHVWQQSQLVAWSAVAGYAAMTTRDYLNGRTRRHLLDEDGNPNLSVYLAALGKGGGLGIMGDFMFSEYDRQYKSALNTFAGPAFGLIDPLGALYTGARRQLAGEATNEHPVGELFNLASNNLPFANLFYVKPVLNAFVFYNIREALSPGVLRRAEKTAREQNYQDFWIEPSEIADIPISEPGKKLETIFK